MPKRPDPLPSWPDQPIEELSSAFLRLCAGAAVLVALAGGMAWLIGLPT